MIQFILSIVTYLLLINNCVTFRIKLIYNIFILIVIVFSTTIIENIVGSLFVIPMYICIVFILWVAKKEDIFYNIFLLVFSYTIFVIFDNLTHLILKHFEWGFNNKWFLYVLINLPIYVAITRFLSIKVKAIKVVETLSLTVKNKMILLGETILCMIIFVLQVTIAKLRGETFSILFGSIVLYLAYFVLTFFLIYNFMKEYIKNTKIIMKQHSYDNLREYMEQIEELYQQIRGFKHDYTNIMVSMSAYINSGDLEGLKLYYNREILPIRAKFDTSNDAVAKLYNLDVVEIKSLLFLKLNYALEMNIDVVLEVTERIDKIDMKIIDIVRVVGILLDNAIEACLECDYPKMQIAVVQINGDVTFIVRNSYIKKKINYSKLGRIGVSSKGENRGVGLYNVKQILGEYKNAFLNTEYGDVYFVQDLQICTLERE